MKEGLASYDLLAVVAELQPLVGGYVDKVYQREDEIILKVHVPGGGRQEVYAKVGRWLCLRETPEKPETPPPFAMALRKHLDNARIAAVEQKGFDRIVTFTFDRGPRLVFELFGKGNVVLVEGDTVRESFRRAKFRDRTVAPGSPYAFPPPAADPLAMDAEAFATALRTAKGSLVKALAAGLNLGGPYAEEVCARADVPKTAKPADLSDEDVVKVHEAVQALAREIRENPQPRVVLEDGAPVDVTPVPLVTHGDREARTFPTLSEAIAHVLEHAPAEVPREDETTAKLRRRLEEQETSLRASREEAVQAESLAMFLYAHFAEFDDLIRRAREGTLAVEGQVLAVDPAARTVRVAVGDIAELSIDWEKDVIANAQTLYERKKEALAKVDRIAGAVRDTEAALAKAGKEAAKAAARPKRKATKRFWFEAYRWCLSSEGFLILGGKDARSNDSVVKKHLDPGDRYAHADVRGAPSCVVKRGSEAGEATLREACAFALAWSKAWPSGLASGSAYWVLPEQVSKQAESGEYVSRGAWVIRGKRNYVHDLPVRAAVGEVEHEGHRKVMAGPVEALEARSARYIVIEPGEEGKEAFARRLAAVFEVPIEEVSRVLPPGPVRVVRQVGIPEG